MCVRVHARVIVADRRGTLALSRPSIITRGAHEGRHDGCEEGREDARLMTVDLVRASFVSSSCICARAPARMHVRACG